MRTALIIDGNYLLHKDVFILYQMKSLHQDLQKLMRIDIEKMMKMYPFDDVYFVSDSKIGYWRKQEFSAYKSDRKSDDKIDWEWVYGEYDSLIDFMSNLPTIKQLQIDLAEGDDIIAYLVNHNNELGYSNVIVAADSDLHQLVRFDLSEEYINIAYNYKFSDERTYFPENYNVFFSEMKRNATSTLFDMNQDDEYLIFLEGLIERTKVIEIVKEELLFVKLIKGDKKDSIPSVYHKKTKTDKLMGIGEAGALSVYNLYKEIYDEPIDFDSNDFVSRATEMVLFSKNITDEKAPELIMNNIKRNRKLTILTDNYLPTSLLDTFNNKIKLVSNTDTSPEVDDFFFS